MPSTPRRSPHRDRRRCPPIPRPPSRRAGVPMSTDTLTPSEPLAPPRRRRPSTMTGAVIVVLVVAHTLAWRGTDFSPAALVQGWRGMADFVDLALPPDLSWSRVLLPGIQAALVTLYIGLLGTTLSIPFAFGLALLAA